MSADAPVFQEPVYLANRPLKVTRDGKLVSVKRGEIIPDFDKWPEGNKRAVLSNGSVILKHAEKPLPKSPNKQILADLGKPVPPPLPPPEEIAEDQELAKEDLLKADPFKCTECDKVFPSQAGLAIHKGRAHGEAVGDPPKKPSPAKPSEK